MEQRFLDRRDLLAPLRCRPQTVPLNSLRQFFPLQRFVRAGDENGRSQTSQDQSSGPLLPIVIGSFRGARVRGPMIALPAGRNLKLEGDGKARVLG
jgi:hypothetical protein